MTSNRSILLSSVIVSGLLLTAGLMSVSFYYLVGTQQQAFDHETSHLANMTSNRIEIVKAEINALATIFYAMNHVDSNSLQASTEYIFTQHGEISKALYAPMIMDAQRSNFESMKQDEGFISFTIHDNHAARATAAKRPSYLPISQIEPFNVDNVGFLGIDLIHLPNVKADIYDAIKTGRDVALVTSLTADKKELWLFKAIYAGFSGTSDPYFTHHSTEMANGLVAIAVDIKQLVNTSSLSKPIAIQIAVENLLAPHARSIIFQSNTQSQTAMSTGINWDGINFIKAFTFKLHHQQLTLQMSLHIAWLDQALLLFSLSGLFGLALTSLLSYSLIALLKSERRNTAILDSAMDAIISVDEHNIVQEFNTAAEHIFNFTSKQVLGRNIIDLLVPERHRAAYKAGMAGYLISGKQNILNRRLERTAIRNNGEEFPLELNIVQVITGKHRLFTAFLRDISTRKKAQDDLAQLAVVVEQSFNAIIITDTNGIIQYVNPAFEALSGYSANEAIGQRPSIVKSDEHSDQYYATMWQALVKEKTWTGSFINQAKDGHLYHVEQTIFPLYVAGKLIAYTAVQQDVTERNRLREQSEHTQRLESLGVLAGGIAHDFNNLLTAIMGNTGLAQNKLPEQSPAKKNLHNIQKASESAATLCQQMLAYSGKGHFIIQPLDLAATIDDIMQLLESSISKRAHLDIQFDQQLPAIDADVGQIKQVIMNLVINASEAIGDQVGQIKIKLTEVNLSVDSTLNLLGADQMQAGDFIRLTIIDNGCGMDQSTRTKIFDPFFTTKFTGRGLGMSAILGIVRGHMGALKVSSTPGKGTRFDVYFPISKQPLQQPANGIADNHQTASVAGTILVVDDDAMLRDLTKSILEESGLQVILAKDGVEALELLHLHLDLNLNESNEKHIASRQTQQIDLIILDMTMPRMGGEECYKQLRSFAPDLHVIICSGYAENEVRTHFDTSCNIDFIQKPYLPSVLEKKINRILLKGEHQTDFI